MGNNFRNTIIIYFPMCSNGYQLPNEGTSISYIYSYLSSYLKEDFYKEINTYLVLKNMHTCSFHLKND